MTKTATKATADAQAAAPPVALSREDARQILELYRMVTSADRHLQKCQSALFRRFVVDTAGAKNVSAAFARLGDALEALGKADAPPAEG